MRVTETEHEILSRRRRWCQFRLRTLLLAPVLVAFVGYWYVDHRRVVRARDEYARIANQYECGLIAVTDLCPASRRLAEAEQQSFFVGTVRARAGHLLRLGEMELGWEAKLEIAEFDEDGRERAGKIFDELRHSRQEAQDWLKEALGR